MVLCGAHPGRTHLWNHDSTMIPSRFPRCRESAVGSKPQYTPRQVSAATRANSSLVVSWINPRALRTATTLAVGRAALVVGPAGRAGSARVNCLLQWWWTAQQAAGSAGGGDTLRGGGGSLLLGGSLRESLATGRGRSERGRAPQLAGPQHPGLLVHQMYGKAQPGRC